MPNPNGNPQALGVTPLEEGELSKVVRVRAMGWVFQAIAGKSAKEVGTLLATALSLSEERVEEARREQGRGQKRPEERGEPPSLDGLICLEVQATSFDGEARNFLRWKEERFKALEVALTSTQRVRLVRGVWRTDSGQTLRAAAVARALQFGLLSPSEG